MNTIQDKSKAPMGKVQDIDGDTKSIHENRTKSECSRKNGCICESVAKSCAVRVPDRTTNLLEEAYDDWVANAVELDRLQTQIHRARKKNYKLQTLIQETHGARYAAMKREHDSALKKAQTEYIAYELTRNKVRRTGNTGEAETANKTYQTTQRTVYPNKESSRRAKVIGKAWERFKISTAIPKVSTKIQLKANTAAKTNARDSVVVISSDSEDDDSDWDTVSGSKSGSKSSKDNANGDGGMNKEQGSLKMNTTGKVNSNITV